MVSPRCLRPAPPLPGLVFQRPSGRALLLALVELLLVLGRLSPIRSVPAAAGYLLACGLFLELAPLLYKPSSVCDPWDLLAYLAGGLLALPLERRLLGHSI